MSPIFCTFASVLPFSGANIQENVKRLFKMGIGKYQITELKKCTADYHNILGDERKDELHDRIVEIIVDDKKYREKNYTASKLAAELGTNLRYISAVMTERFHTNFNGLVNKHRIEEAMMLLAGEEYRDMSITEIGEMVGFGTRQAFYASFFRFLNTTPREFRVNHLGPKKRKRRTKKD
jgi:AraC-like DNA-binding protein